MKEVDFCTLQESAGPFVVLIKRATKKENEVAPLIGAPLFGLRCVETAPQMRQGVAAEKKEITSERNTWSIHV